MPYNTDGDDDDGGYDVTKMWSFSSEPHSPECSADDSVYPLKMDTKDVTGKCFQLPTSN